ncbi:MAG: hypothetical protein AAF498_05780 [Pseudomonadota bacterium]
MNPVTIAILLVLVIGIGLATWKAPRLTSVILWALVATIFSTAALLLIVPGPFSEKALWIALSVPFVWVAFQFWCYWDANKWRVAGGLIAVSALCGIIVFLSDPIV